MSGIGAAIVGGSAITGLLSANAQSDAAKQAAAAQLQTNQQALAAQKANYAQGVQQQNTALASGTAAAGQQNNSLQQLLAPFIGAGAPGINGLENYATAGQNALGQQANLTGTNGAGAQSDAIEALRNSPTFQALLQQGNTGVLQNASATGGLRGGNTIGALAQLDPALLSQQIQLQLQNLGTLSTQGSAASQALASLGAGSAGTQAQGTQQTLASLLGLQGGIAGNIAGLSGANTQATTNLIGQQGQIGATNALAQGQAQANLYGGINAGIGTAAGLANRTSLASLLSGGGGATTPAAYTGQLNLSGLGAGEGSSLLSALGMA